MVLKYLILNSFYFGSHVVVLKELIFTVSTLGVCGVLERTSFSHFLPLGGCGGHERTVF